MLITLVIVAGSAKAQTNSSPYPGGTYDYTVTGIVVQTAGTAKIEYLNDLNAPLAGATISAVTGFGGTDPNYTVATGGITLTFKVKWATDVAAGKIRVTVTDGLATGGCTNFIEMKITPAQLPTFAVAIANVTASPYCQTKAVSPEDKTPASDGQTNSIEFRVTPVVTHVTTDYSYTYTIDLAGSGLTGYTITSTNSGYVSGTGVVTSTRTNGAAPSVDTFTATFTTTTGHIPVNIAGAISGASITITSGGAKYDAPATTAMPVIVNTMPSIGSFN